MWICRNCQKKKNNNWLVICLSQWRSWLILSASVRMLWHKWRFSISDNAIHTWYELTLHIGWSEQQGVFSTGISWKCYFKKSCHAHIWILRGINAGKYVVDTLSCVALSGGINFTFHFYVHIMNPVLAVDAALNFHIFSIKMQIL